MDENKVEIMTQPRTDVLEPNVTGAAKQKLRNLVEHDLNENEPTPTPPTNKQKDILARYENAKKADSSENATSPRESQTEVEEVTHGKIPLDSQFSTKEIKKLIDVAKNSGMLEEELEVKIVDSTPIAERVVIESKPKSDDDDSSEDHEEKEERK
ncbi:uncharacterized protein J8A68_005169 [[Candida] subhashii]|uniref:Uncharacterized protein n=1 Tax=[Candida] subhashii TaxID=561895 RepID=A0A8J5UIH8_9ASCO|nr:uncharacterized protein J8A68_005169 [[Candida] subhashii]KAG7661277.1 hypothetical protein J8A68_005169 [[Candida] subhashii]